MFTEYQQQFQQQKTKEKVATRKEIPFEYQSEYAREFSNPMERLKVTDVEGVKVTERVQETVTDTITETVTQTVTDTIKDTTKDQTKTKEIITVEEHVQVGPETIEKATSMPTITFRDTVVNTIESGENGSERVKITQTDAVSVPVSVPTEVVKVTEKTSEKTIKADKENVKPSDVMNTISGPNKPAKPVMAQYGIANTNPTIPTNYMKTFNVRAPLDQVYTTTKLHSVYQRDFHKREQERKKVGKNSLPDPEKVLKEYKKARELVKEIQAVYKSEYQNQYQDWTSSIDKIKKSTAASAAANGTATVSTAKPTTNPKTEKSHLLKPLKKREPVEYTQVQSIYQQMNNSEKRHYELPKTFDLALQLLDRAESRQSTR